MNRFYKTLSLVPVLLTVANIGISLGGNPINDKPAAESASFPSSNTHGVIGITEEIPFDNPVDNIFHVNIQEPVCMDDQVWLVYELDGVEDHTNVSRSINDQVSVGGYLVKKRRGWQIQRERVHAAWIKDGDNVVRFTMPANASHAYKIRNLKFEIQRAGNTQAQNAQVVFNQPSPGYFFEKAYLKGFVTGAGYSNARVKVAGVEARVFNGEFESLIDFSNPQNCSVDVEVRYPDGSSTCHVVSYNEPHTADYVFTHDQQVWSTEKYFDKNMATSVSLKDAAVTANPGALNAGAMLSITTLRSVDIPALDAGMVNVTGGLAGFRFLPHGSVFQKSLQVSIPYDVSSIPEGYTEADIRTYYFDETSHHWVPLPIDTLFSESSLLVSNTLHFTDMINGIIKVPESPEVEAYNSNSIKEIKAANPTAAINMISPPQASNAGVASLAYPIKVPAGRRGMQPELSISYSNAGGNGWLGMGWNLSVPAISIDTRWGSPRYSPQKETETYTFNGEQLAPTAHREELVDRNSSGEKQFRPRVERAFAKITRFGNFPSSYTWVVTDKNGTRYFYGGDENAPDENFTLTDSDGNIGYWALKKVLDVNGNFMEYVYDKITDNAPQPGIHFYIKEIHYAGHAAASAPYKVLFFRESGRTDVGITANLGYKHVVADLLKKIEVTYNEKPIRHYSLNYRQGAFYKSLLESIEEFDAEGKLFTTHSFDYYDDVQSADGYTPFKTSQQWQVGDDGKIRGDFKKRIEDEFDDNASMLSGTKSKDRSIGMAVTVGFNPRVMDKTFSVGGSFSSSTSESESILTMIDLNGDALPDKVFMKGDKLHYRPNLGTGSEGSFGDAVEVKYNGGSMGTFFREKSKTKSGGLEAHGPAAAPLFGGYSRSKTVSEQSIYFTEVNGDQLIDLVQKGKVLFGRINPDTGHPEFTDTSAETPSPIFQGSDVAGIDGQTDEDALQLALRENPLHDVVKMWEAPYSGVISITAPARLLEIADDERAETPADGVRIAIQHNDTEKWIANIAPTDYSVYEPTGLTTVSVNKGDRIYFRVGSVYHGKYDQVAWTPVIDYTSLPFAFIHDANNKSYTHYNSRTDFKQSAVQKISPPEKGRIKIESRFIKPGTSDDVQLEIIRETTSEEGEDPNLVMATDTLWLKKYAYDTAVAVDTVFEFDVEKGHHLRFKVHSNTNVDWANIVWTTRMYYTSLADPRFQDQDLFDEGGNPQITFYPVCEYSMYNQEQQQTEPIKIDGETDTVQVTVIPKLEFRDPSILNPIVHDGKVYFTVKKKNQLLLKDTLYIDNNEVVETDLQYAIKVPDNDTIFVEYHTEERVLASDIILADVAIVVNGDSETRHAGVHTVVEEKMIFGPMYHQWGHFAYHSNGRENAPIVQSDLRVDGDDLKNRAPRRDPNDFSNGNDLKDGNSYKPYDEKFIILVPLAKDQIWIGYDNDTYVSATGISSSRMSDDDPRTSVSTVQPGSGGKAISKMTETISNAYSLGASAGFIGASATYSDGSTKVVADFMDFNGDRYPDVVMGNRVQFTNARGGLSEDVFNYSTDYNTFSTNTATGLSMSGSFNTSKGEGGLSWNVKKAQVSIGDGKSSAGLSANIGEGDNSTDFSWLDINGDGLPDRVSKSGAVQLNLGYKFGEVEQWGHTAVQDGESTNEGAGLGISLWNGSISAGIGLARSDNEVSSTLADVNGDGLPDLVTYQDGAPLQVRFNTGNAFANGITWKGATHVSSSSSTSQSANVAFTAGIYIPAPINIKITVNPSYSEGRGASRELVKIMDVDGDGFPDYITSRKYDQLNVALSTIERTNMLRKVTRPLGATFTMSYKRIGNTYEMPSSTWVLDSVNIFDGFADDGVDNLLTTFAYEEGYHDRYEREFFGFAKVITNTHDTSKDGKPVYTRLTQSYNNSSYSEKGLLLSELLEDGEGRKFVEKENIYELKDVAPEVQFPALTEASQKFYEGQSDAGKHTRMTYAYNEHGEIVTFNDFGDEGTNDDIIATIAYHQIDSKNILNIPQKIVVTASGVQYRHRETVIDENSGDITQIKQFLSDTEVAVHDMEYDQFGNMKKITRPKNSKGQRLAYDYAFDNEVYTYPVKVTSSYGYSSETVYDLKFGQKLSTKDLNGNEIKYEVDAAGRVISVQGPYEKGGANKTIEFEYHADAEIPWALTRHFDPTNPKNKLQTATFVDGLGRVLQVKKDIAVYAGDGKPDTEIMQVSGRVYFDAFGRTIKVHYPTTGAAAAPEEFIQEPDGETPTTTTYDILNRPLVITLPDGAVIRTEFGFEQDRFGKTQFSSKTTDANGKQTEQFADVKGKVTSVKHYTSDKPVWTSFRYNAMNEQVEATNDLDQTTFSAYDNLGRRIERKHPDAGTTIYRYDLAGNLIELITPNLGEEGLAISYGYHFERLEEIEYPQHPENNVHYTYGEAGASDNRAGRIVLQEDATGAQEFFYGALGEMVKNVRTIIIPQHGDQTYTTSWQYDSWNRLLSIIYADGEQVTYDYNQGGLLRAMSGKKKNASYNYVNQLGYDKFEQRVFLAFGNGTKSSYDYEPKRRRLKNMSAKTAANRLFMDNAYAYDKTNNVLSLTNNAPIPSANLMGGTSDYSFNYDDLYRLTSAEGFYKGANDQHSYTLSMSYNTVGAITNKTQVHRRKDQVQKKTSYALDYTYEESHPNAPIHIGELSYTYDANGNQTGWTSDISGQRRKLMWDEDNRLRAVYDNGALYHYLYDGAGDRVLKGQSTGQRIFVNGEWKAGSGQMGNYTVYVNPYLVLRSGGYTKHYYVEDQRIVSKLGGGWDNNGQGPLKAGGDKVDYAGKGQRIFDGIVKNLKFLGADGQILTAGKSGKVPPGQVKGTGNIAEAFRYFYHTDHLGSTSYVTDASGEVFQHLEYSAWGETLVEEHSNTDRTPYLFNGKELDEETGLYCYGARYYDPRTSMWQSVDPLVDRYPSLSGYAYTGNNPLSYTDPDGRKIRGVKIVNGEYVFSAAAEKNGTKRYVLARIQTETGRAKINAMIADRRTYNIGVTDKTLVLPSGNEGKYALAAGVTDAASGIMYISTDKTKIEDLTPDQLKNGLVTIDKSGDLVEISLNKDQLERPLEDPNGQYQKDYQKAYEDSGAKAFYDNPDNKPKDADAEIHATGAHEETHLTDKQNIEYSNDGDTYNTEKQAFEVEIQERKEYIKAKTKTEN